MPESTPADLFNQSPRRHYVMRVDPDGKPWFLVHKAGSPDLWYWGPLGLARPFRSVTEAARAIDNTPDPALVVTWDAAHRWDRLDKDDR